MDIEGKRNLGGLERFALAASMIVVFLGIFFLSSNFTGNTIMDLSTKTTSFLGAGLLIVGLVVGFFWLKRNKTFHFRKIYK